MLRPFFESIIIHFVFVAIVFGGTLMKGQGVTERPTVLEMSTSIIQAPEPAAAVEQIQPEPQPEQPPVPQPVQPLKPKPKPKPVAKPVKDHVPVEPVKEAVKEPDSAMDSVAESSDNVTSDASVQLVAMAAPSVGGASHGGSQSAGGSDSLYRLKDLDKKPQILNNAKPIYPRYATENRIEGSVTVSFVLDKNGNVTTPEVVKADPANVFENSAINAVKKWKFTPAKKNGSNVNVRMIVVVNFILENG